MRRLVLLSIAMLLLFGVVVWLVIPMFVVPREARLADCDSCEALLRLVPADAERVVVVPHGGTTLFELARRIDPGKEISEALPAPGILAIGLGNAPVVAWIDSRGRVGAAAKPSGPRKLLTRIAAHKYGGRGVRLSDGMLIVGEPGRSGTRSVSEFGDEDGHFFALHDLGSSPSTARSVGRLGSQILDIETFLDGPVESIEPIGKSQHPDSSVVSVAVANLSSVLGPIEKVLPVRIGDWGTGAGQIVVYDFETKGLIPRIYGILFVESDDLPSEAAERVFPSIAGATLDTLRTVGEVEVFRRETLGVVIETALIGGRLAIALDGASIDRWTRGELHEADADAIWSFDGNPGEIDRAIAGLQKSPGRYVLSRSAQRRLATLRAVVGPLRTATRVTSSLVRRSGGSVIVSRVTW